MRAVGAVGRRHQEQRAEIEHTADLPLGRDRTRVVQGVRRRRDAGWDQIVVTLVTALVLIAGYGLLLAAQHVSRANREKDGASF